MRQEVEEFLRAGKTLLENQDGSLNDAEREGVAYCVHELERKYDLPPRFDDPPIATTFSNFPPID